MTEADPSPSESPAAIPRGERLVAALLALLVVVQPLLHWPAYAGDSVIHLVFAENTAAGAPFTFNPGEPSSGVTSPGYMLLLAGLFRALPAEQVPVAVKLLGLLAWWLSVAFTFLLARDVLSSGRWAWAAAFVAGSLPGSVYNANIGMETGLFVAWLAGWMWLVERWRWLDSPVLPWTREVGVGVLLGLGFWLRPEAFVVAAVAFPVRLLAWRRGAADASTAVALPSMCLCALAALAVASTALAYHFAYTGDWLPTSGRARTFIANLRSPRVAGLPVDVRFGERLLYYAPLTAGMASTGALLVLRPLAIPHRRLLLFFAVTFWACFALYTFVTGASHLARYVAFLMPGFVISAFVAAKWLYEAWDAVVPVRARGWRSLGFVFLGAALAGLMGFEASVRLGAVQIERSDRLGSSALAVARAAPGRREAQSTALLAQLGHPEERPVIVAMQEVQLRYEIDDRFVVRSLDGRVDARLLDFATPDGVDHIGYLKERGVHYLLAAPHYVRDPRRWSIASLRRLEPGRSVQREGLRFTRLPDGRAWRIDPAPQGRDGKHVGGARPRARQGP